MPLRSHYGPPRFNYGSTQFNPVLEIVPVHPGSFEKGRGTRFCVDYRRLNDVTVKDAYPLPIIDDTLDMLVGKQWFSTLDLASGYWQVSLSQEARIKTAFATHSGLFQFRVMPFGLCNAPMTFERLMDRVLQGLGGPAVSFIWTILYPLVQLLMMR